MLLGRRSVYLWRMAWAGLGRPGRADGRAGGRVWGCYVVVDSDAAVLGGRGGLGGPEQAVE
jgi:hypothetical protein